MNNADQSTPPPPPPTWTDEMESSFLSSFIAEGAVYRPVGTPKHFAMLLAYDRFTKSLPSDSTPSKNLDIEQMWSKLESLYDLDSLEQDSSPPFPNERREFSLPRGWVDEEEVGEKKKKRAKYSSSSSSSTTDSSISISSDDASTSKRKSIKPQEKKKRQRRL